MQIQRIALAAIAAAAFAAPTASAVIPTEPGNPSQAQAAYSSAAPREVDESAALGVAPVRAEDTGVEVTTALAGGLVLLAAILLTGTAVLRRRNGAFWA